METKSSQGLEQAVDRLTGNGMYRQEVDKLLSGVVISGLIGGTVIAMYGASIDKDVITGIGYGILYGDALVGLSIFAERYLRNRFAKALEKRSQSGG